MPFSPVSAVATSNIRTHDQSWSQMHGQMCRRAVRAPAEARVLKHVLAGFGTCMQYPISCAGRGSKQTEPATTSTR